MELRRVAHETARLRLARYRVAGNEARHKGAQYAAQVSAEALGVERVGVWMFKGPQLVCSSLYERSTRTHSAGQTLLLRHYPKYVQTLRSRRVLAADDAWSHPITSELRADYLEPLGITSLLDAPVIRNGRVIGVVCHEHQGPPRAFSPSDLEFAIAVADMVTLIFEQADRLELEVALQEQTEERLAREKMEALGRMARVVAHDFNNLLSSASLAIETLSSGVSPALRGTIDALSSSVEMSQRLTRQLLTFGRASDETPGSAVDLVPMLDKLLPLLRGGVGKQIELSTDLRLPHAWVVVNPTHFEQVVLNLCLNARDAIAGPGTIRLVLREATEEDELPPEHVVLEVVDSGEGIAETDAERIFEPFFTTKGHGTGLGLATVYGIVSRAQGTVRARSAPPAGTTMRVSLPCVRA